MTDDCSVRETKPPARPRVSVAVVIPCYHVGQHIDRVVRQLPPWVAHIIAVNDGSTDSTGAVLASLASEYTNITVVTHDHNRGVGAATMTGMAIALEREADVIVKMDGDGQMSSADLPRLLVPLLDGTADIARGDRLASRTHSAQMPRLRLLGNVVLTLLTKVSSGYASVSDAQNGFIAVTRRILRQIPFHKMEPRYAFENSLLVRANLIGAVVEDVAMIATYGDEKSSLRLWTSAIVFPLKISRMFASRVFEKHMMTGISPVGLSVIGSVASAFAFGVGFSSWTLSYAYGVRFASTGMALGLLVTALATSITLLVYGVARDMRTAPRLRAPIALISATLVPHLCATTKTDDGETHTYATADGLDVRNAV